MSNENEIDIDINIRNTDDGKDDNINSKQNLEVLSEHVVPLNEVNINNHVYPIQSNTNNETKGDKISNEIHDKLEVKNGESKDAELSNDETVKENTKEKKK